MNCFNGPNVNVLKEQRNHIEKRKPAIALLVVFDYEELPQKSRQDVPSFVLWCKHPDGPQWNLAAAGTYGVDIAEAAFQEYGTLQGQKVAIIAMVQNGCSGQKVATRIVGLMRHLAEQKGSTPRFCTTR